MRIMPLDPISVRHEMSKRDCWMPEKMFDFGMAVTEMRAMPCAMGGCGHSDEIETTGIVIMDQEVICGLIGMYADGKECKLGHLWTDGTELVGSVLYGAAWRAAKALGYKQITL